MFATVSDPSHLITTHFLFPPHSPPPSFEIPPQVSPDLPSFFIMSYVASVNVPSISLTLAIGTKSPLLRLHHPNNSLSKMSFPHHLSHSRPSSGRRSRVPQKNPVLFHVRTTSTGKWSHLPFTHVTLIRSFSRLRSSEPQNSPILARFVESILMHSKRQQVLAELFVGLLVIVLVAEIVADTLRHCGLA